MKQKFILLVFSLSFFPMILFSQSGEIPICTTTEYSANFSMMENVRIPDYSGYEFGLKIYVHVLSHTDTGPGQSILGVNEALKYLYEDFDKLGIYFIWDGEIDYVLNNDWYLHPPDYLNSIFGYNYHTDGIDIYLGDSLSRDPVSQAAAIGGTTAFIVNGFQGAEDNNIFRFLPQSNTMTHEMGHVLFLWHTFHGTTNDSGADTCPECLESTDPQNGSAWYCGDYVFDTPPDPNFAINFNSDCGYVGGGQDICGNDFRPLGNNFMSYAPLSCRDEFTPGQIRRMKNAIALLPQLQQTRVQDYTYIRGQNILCGGFLGTFTIYSNDTSNITVELSDNLINAVITTFPDKIEIAADGEFNLFEGDHAWIIAKRNDIEIARKNFWVGKPQKMINNSILGPENISPNDEVEYYVPSRLEGARTYQWVLPGLPAVQVQPFVPNELFWQYDYRTSYFNILTTMIGECDGELLMYGINECGFDDNFDQGVGLIVTNSGTYPNCPGEAYDVVYYPNPADDLLNIDLSLQAYKVFDIVVYNNSQIAVYTAQSTNVVKTIDTFNLNNGTYYLHIYDGSVLILSKILIINH